MHNFISDSVTILLQSAFEWAPFSSPPSRQFEEHQLKSQRERAERKLEFAKLESEYQNKLDFLQRKDITGEGAMGWGGEREGGGGILLRLFPRSPSEAAGCSHCQAGEGSQWPAEGGREETRGTTMYIYTYTDCV